MYSPDTDVYNIGLSLISTHPNTDFIIQLNVPYSEEKYLCLNNLLKALKNDPDLATLPQNKLGKIFQTLFICSGCDYTSYFNGHGKATILNTSYYSKEFINSVQMPGCLSETSTTNNKSGFLSFVRLIGTLYFKKYFSAFVSVYGFDTPNQLFNSFGDSSLPLDQKHQQWLEKIRGVVSERLTNEEDRVPSYTALWRHWLRTCWISEMYNNSPQQNLFEGLPLPENSGWKIEGSTFKIDWDSPDMQDKVKGFLTKGCSCKRGCKTRQCGCRKKSQHCGPGCECHGCVNLPVLHDSDTHTESDPGSEYSSVNGSSTEEGSDSELEMEIVTSMVDMDDIFEENFHLI